VANTARGWRITRSAVEHSHPQHTHESWTLINLDRGTISYELDGRERSSTDTVVTLLPPQVPHNGRSVLPAGSRKRVLYVDADVWTDVGAAVDAPTLVDLTLRQRISRLHAERIAGRDPTCRRDAPGADWRCRWASTTGRT
jgi:hypothetical protein